MSDFVVNPYHGYVESYDPATLDAASQHSGFSFDAAVVQAAPGLDQIAVADSAHYEACGWTAATICACACGLVPVGDGLTTVKAGLDYARAQGWTPQYGADTWQIMQWCQSRGWAVTGDNRPSGQMDTDLAGRQRVGVTALNTAYGTGQHWNDLHPQAGGGVGHFEVIGAVGDAYRTPTSGDEPLNLAQKRALCFPMRILTASAWPEDQPTLDYYAARVADDGGNLEDIFGEMLADARKGGRVPLFERQTPKPS